MALPETSRYVPDRLAEFDKEEVTQWWSLLSRCTRP
jgi:hypothetical protein